MSDKRSENDHNKCKISGKHVLTALYSTGRAISSAGVDHMAREVTERAHKLGGLHDDMTGGLGSG